MGKIYQFLMMSMFCHAAIVVASEEIEKSASSIQRSPVVQSPVHQEEIRRVLSGKSSIFGSSYSAAERAIMQQRHSPSQDRNSPFLDRTDSGVSSFNNSISVSPGGFELTEHGPAFRTIKEHKIITGRDRPGRSKGVISYKGGLMNVKSSDGSDFYYYGSEIPAFVNALTEGTKYAGDTVSLRDDQGRMWKFQKVSADPSKGIKEDYIRGTCC